MKLRELISWTSTGVAACCAIAVLTLPILGPDSAKKTGELAISLVAALGTLGAVIVSLHLARKSGENDREAQKLIAEITANKLHTPVFLLLAKVHTCQISIASANRAKHNLTRLPLDIAEAIPARMLKFEHEDLIRLAPLPEKCAVRLASSINALEKLLIDLQENGRLVQMGIFASEQALLDRWLVYLNWAASQLKEVEKVLHSSSLDAPICQDPGDSSPV